MYSWFNIKNISVYVTKSCIIKLLKTKYVLPNWVLSTVLNGETEKDPGGNHAAWASMFLWLIKQVVTKRCKYRLFIQYGWFQLTHSPRKPPLCHPILFFYFKQVNDNFKHYRIVCFFFFLMFSFCVLGELLNILYSIRMLAMTERPKFSSWRKLSKF